MAKQFSSRRWLVGLVVLALLLTCCIGRPGPMATPAADPALVLGTADSPETMELSVAAESTPESGSATLAGSEPWYNAVATATQAAQLAQTAITAQDWNQVAQAWSQSVALLQDIPADDPRQMFSQRKAREYLQNLEVAQQRAEQKGAIRVFPALGSGVLDEQVSLYRSYVATLGPPDILIMGSSRALQGIDPQALQQYLSQEGYPGLRAYNFSVNGATAQVISFLTRQLFAPDLYPKLVLWAEGSRAFNSGRFDRTFAEMLASPGYTAVRGGAQLSLETEASLSTQIQGTVPVTQITAQGFLPIEDRFNPAIYYLTFPRVSGQYDDSYRSFRLDGVQTVSFEAVTQFFDGQNIPLVFVNLPLSDNYLDGVRLRYERQFQSFLQRWAQGGSITLLDFLERWRGQPQLFADPSHINRFGALEVTRLIAADGRIPWAELMPPASNNSAPGSRDDDGEEAEF